MPAVEVVNDSHVLRPDKRDASRAGGGHFGANIKFTPPEPAKPVRVIDFSKEQLARYTEILGVLEERRKAEGCAVRRSP